jgi:hypothetical protein
MNLLGTETSITGGRVKLVLWAWISPLNEIMYFDLENDDDFCWWQLTLSCTYDTMYFSLVVGLVFGLIFQIYVVVSFIGEGNRSTHKKPRTCCKSLTNFITQCCTEYISPWTGFKGTILVVTHCSCRCKSNYHEITITTVPFSHWNCVLSDINK